jgi:nucleoid DNA-binding protein
VLVGACRGDAPAPTPTPTPTSATDDNAIAARLADELVKLAPEQVLALPDLGWLQMKRYRGYNGRNPRTGEAVAVPDLLRPFWVPTSGPWDQHLTDERHRFLLVLHPDDAQAIADDDPAIQVRRFAWADAICEAAARELATKHTTTLAGIGTFTSENGDVRYTIAPELEQRLTPGH